MYGRDDRSHFCIRLYWLTFSEPYFEIFFVCYLNYLCETSVLLCLGCPYKRRRSGSLDKYYWECISFVNVCRHIYQSVYFCKTFSAWWRLLAFIERALRYTYLIYTKLKGPWILFAKMPDSDNPSMCNRNVTRDLLNLCDKLYKIRSELSVLPIYYNCELRCWANNYPFVFLYWY